MNNDLLATKKEKENTNLIIKNMGEIEFLKLLGKGAFGEVFKGIHKPSSSIIVIKSQNLTKKKDLDAIKEEVNIMKSCTSPFIVKYFGSLIEKNPMPIKMTKSGMSKMKVHIFMEYCELGSIRKIIKERKHPFSEPEIGLLCKDILNGIHYLHSQGKMHRDIKSDNILITGKGIAKLSDFGISKNSNSNRNTLVGTPHFLAPEVVSLANPDSEIQSNGYDFKVDIWALGITLIEMAEMKPPYFQDNALKVVFMICNNDAPTLSNPAKWSKEFNNFVKVCLIKDSKNRPNTSLLFQHPFLQKYPEDSAIRQQLVTEMRAIQLKNELKEGTDLSKSEQNQKDFEEMKNNINASQGNLDQLEDLKIKLSQSEKQLSEKLEKSFEIDKTGSLRIKETTEELPLGKKSLSYFSSSRESKSISSADIFMTPKSDILKVASLSPSLIESLRLEVRIVNCPTNQTFILYFYSNSTLADFYQRILLLLDTYPDILHHFKGNKPSHVTFVDYSSIAPTVLLVDLIGRTNKPINIKLISKIVLD